MSAQNARIRPAAVAGQFYPGQPSVLRAQVEDMLSRAPDAPLEGKVRGLMAPHAGYPFSGQTAAAAYRQIRGREYDAVVVMAPSHYEACNGASLFPGGGYETPLGVAHVNRDMVSDLVDADPSLSLSMTGHQVAADRGIFSRLAGEHALEVQLPFLQVALPNLSIVPIVIGCHDLSTCRRLADVLVRASQSREVLLVASSDLYHGPDHEACVATDTCSLEDIGALHPEQFVSDLETGRAQACGAGPILVLMLAARQMGADRVHIIGRTNSDDALGERRDYVVGYGAALFCEKDSDDSHQEGLSQEDRLTLGKIARDAVRSVVCGSKVQAPEYSSSALKSERGAFVTLHCRDRLRGCIGDIHGREPLDATVHHMAIAAATRDPRFPPVSVEELDHLEIEISVLTPMRQIASPSEVEVGRHGVWIRRGIYQGVLLPQVPVEQGWNRTQFLDHACLKAQLPSAAWQQPETEIWTFSAEVFPA